jgi:hypothetical protein
MFKLWEIEQWIDVRKLNKWINLSKVGWCRNFNLGLATKVRAYEGAGQKWSLGVTFHALRSVGVWESVREWTSTLPHSHTPKSNGISDELKHVGQFEKVEKWLNLDKLDNEWTFLQYFKVIVLF